MKTLPLISALCASCGLALAETGPSTAEAVQQRLDSYQQEQVAWLQSYLKGPVPESAQFNFILGEWNTTLAIFDAAGEVVFTGAGFWRGESIDGGRMIMDEYIRYLPDGSQVHGGRTLRTYSIETQRWEMTYLQPMKDLLIEEFVGRKVGDEIHAETKGLDLSGQMVLAKVRFYDISADSFKWRQDNSFDGGNTWYKGMTIEAERIR